MEFLSSRASTLEGMEQTKVLNQSSHKPQLERAQGFVARPNNLSAGTRSKMWICNCCGRPHHTETCHNSKDPNFESRVTMVKERRVCYICLERHTGADCPHPRPCKYTGCNLYHHRLLHGIDLRKFFAKKPWVNQRNNYKSNIKSTAPQRSATQ